MDLANCNPVKADMLQMYAACSQMGTEDRFDDNLAEFHFVQDTIEPATRKLRGHRELYEICKPYSSQYHPIMCCLMFQGYCGSPSNPYGRRLESDIKTSLFESSPTKDEWKERISNWEGKQANTLVDEKLGLMPMSKKMESIDIDTVVLQHYLQPIDETCTLAFQALADDNPTRLGSTEDVFCYAFVTVATL
mmetsp:Transcript_20451/g.23466  ORF Transcript_20451/g.23466 Transcript_20451/m.23466 type:complete len:192 (-) Transcript_20451:823-1398(-)|eukprot:CAMPEP_0194437728 /NCGR_PEP_ID=MMETSP0176-20130528/101595_1 /TAXON_ID=216777 /ORGANISM="Proboscia alata, Strain PI-D3" /LENGTH=191 /DNA_ID=CAMNT_0039259289 /DNA_START=469 /DNA_END=1044 /DNA_ORIENTATION=+